ncbi:MAG: mechanosensitive ion channel domain-containing protein, partial [Planctomycetota bacterium]
ILVRYLIVIIGTVAICQQIGLGWAEIQWLLAGLSVGIGFGLQEIVANFFSGLILLFERPIRVGDMVTVGDVNGRVTEIRMRATKVQDFDMRDLVVPNKQFITTQIINWTLSNPVSRVVIPVSIPPGSDTEKARDILLKAAQNNPLVLEDPAPFAIFRSFDENTLNFELYVYIRNRKDWFSLLDKVHSEINTEFRKAGIDLALRRSDIRIRSIEAMRRGVLEADSEPELPQPSKFPRGIDPGEKKK